MMDKQQTQEFIAKRVAKEFMDGDLVNLGIGLPTLVAEFIPEGLAVDFQSENGFIGVGPVPAPGKEDPNIVNAGGINCTVLPGGSFFDSSLSFGIIRGGHVAATVLGALQVDEKGNIANYMIPGKMVPGMGGAMDLCVGAKHCIVCMEHTAKGNPKIFEKCRLPLTASHCVNKIITEMCVLEVTDKGLLMTEINPESTVEQVQAATAAPITVSENLKSMVD